MKCKLLKILAHISLQVIGLLYVANIGAVESVRILGENEVVTIPAYASMILDPECKHPIDNFELSNKLMMITKVTGSIWANGGDYKQGLQVAKTMNWLPISLEAKLGEQLHGIRVNSHEIINPDTKNKRYAKLYSKANKILDDAVYVLPKKLPFKVKIFITTGKGINASAQPGGYIYLTKKAAQQDKNLLAVLIGHELSHITKRHTTMQYQSTIVDSLTTLTQFKSLMGNVDVEQIANLAITTSNIIMSYGQKQEAQADVCAVHTVTRMEGYQIKKGAKEFINISKDRDDSDDAMFAQHPKYEEREKLFQLAMNDSATAEVWDKSKHDDAVIASSTDIEKETNEPSKALGQQFTDDAKKLGEKLGSTIGGFFD